jgi:hypothetical protein
MKDGDKYVFDDGEVELEPFSVFEIALQRFTAVLVPLARDFRHIIDSMLTTLGDCECSTKEALDVAFSDMKRLV